jgi:CheY-like chemotaxis protein
MQAEAPVIIVADDDRDDSLVLIMALLSLKQELTIIAVSNGEELINMLRRVSPEFIFLDINMPKKMVLKL